MFPWLGINNSQDLMAIYRFNDPQNPDFVFKPEYHKRIPADGYHIYASGIWDKVLTNKDLDLPTQQELLAQYRCDEISSVSCIYSAALHYLILMQYVGCI